MVIKILISMLLFFNQTKNKFLQAHQFELESPYLISEPEPEICENIKNLKVIRNNDTYLPFLAALDIHNADGTRIFCTGTYIRATHFDYYFVLTSADCVKDAENIYVQFGVYSYSRDTDEIKDPPRCKAVVNSFDIIPHDNFNNYTLENNIALIRIIDYDTGLCLSGDGSKKKLESLRIHIDNLSYPLSHIYDVCGRGMKQNDSNIANPIAKCIGLPIVENKECRNIYHNVHEDEICAAFNTTSICNVDRGSPLIFNNTVIAVVSAEILSCNAGSPLLFVKVLDHIKWLRDTINS